ncbi:MAG: GntR family transcriptional regulator [Erysipelotrichales bacterium]|nr:GntR family transcriptional regulator [Erysipelotrichales bacterium]
MRTESKLSVYESIVERIKREISLGILTEGERLPSCRELALEMGVNPNTVQRAYSTLEEQGIIYTIPKKGVYVNSGKTSNILCEAKNQIKLLKELGVTKEQLKQIIDNVFEEDENND